MDFQLTVNGFDFRASYPDETVKNVLLPLLRKLTDMHKAQKRRIIALLAAPPGTGKSTLAAVLEELSRQDESLVPVQALGMDGFHRHQDYLLSHTVLKDGEEIPMAKIKGMPETFDADKLRRTLLAARDGKVLWPVYDRRIHDVVEDAMEADAPILIVEGNWLLLDKPEWSGLPCDMSIFVGAEESQLRERLIMRKMRGGLTREEAEAFYARTDGPNVRLCMAESRPANLRLALGEDGALVPENH